MTLHVFGRDRAYLSIVLLAGLVARVIVWSISSGFVYPDEIFQYVEPANLRLTGLGWLPWEYERGLRNWILPGFYGGIMWWLHQLSLDGFTIHRVLGLHNALASLLLIPAAYRLADALAGRAAARTAAVWAALYVPILFYMPHTLNEVPGVLLTTWGLAWWAEDRNRDRFGKTALRAGVALGAAIVIRPPLVLWTIVPCLDWLLRGQARRLLAFSAGALIVVAIGGAVDWITWGRPLHSTIEFVRYNLLEDGASRHGESPWDFYLNTWLWQRMGIGAVICVALAAFSPLRGGLILLAACVPMALLSAIGHKEERFLLGSYPLLLVAGSVGLAQVLDATRERTRDGRTALAAAVVAIVLAAGAVGSRTFEWRWRAGIFQGQQLVGRLADATGVLLDDRLHMNGGYLVLDRNIPQLPFSTQLASHQLFSDLVLLSGSPEARWAARSGFEAIAVLDEATVFRRQRSRSAAR